MITSVDLDGPLDDFRGRVAEMRSIVIAIEAVSRLSTPLATTRPGVSLTAISAITENTANSMSLIFLASSFEEFVREEISQCATYLAMKYPTFVPDTRHAIRSRYWEALLEQVKYSPSILTKNKPKIPDSSKIALLRKHVDSIKGFVVDDDVSASIPKIFATHTRNFRPHVVDELAARLGIKEFVAAASDNSKVKSYFGVSKKADSAKKIKEKLDEFYERRNETVHSLSGITGFATNVILDYLNFFEITAESMKNVLSTEISSW